MFATGQPMEKKTQKRWAARQNNSAARQTVLLGKLCVLLGKMGCFDTGPPRVGDAVFPLGQQPVKKCMCACRHHPPLEAASARGSLEMTWRIRTSFLNNYE